MAKPRTRTKHLANQQVTRRVREVADPVDARPRCLQNQRVDLAVAQKRHAKTQAAIKALGL